MFSSKPLNSLQGRLFTKQCLVDMALVVKNIQWILSIKDPQLKKLVSESKLKCVLFIEFYFRLRPASVHTYRRHVVCRVAMFGDLPMFSLTQAVLHSRPVLWNEAQLNKRCSLVFNGVWCGLSLNTSRVVRYLPDDYSDKLVHDPKPKPVLKPERRLVIGIGVYKRSK